MKNYLLVAFQLIVTLAYSQKQHVNEDFNNSALPLNWTNDSVSGSHFWFFGVDGANLHSGNQNIDGTPMAFFDDDEGKITHVGIIMTDYHIIHAFGKVRIDRLDQTGIFNNSLNAHTQTTCNQENHVVA